MTADGTLNEDGLLVSAPDTIAVFSGGWIRPLDPDPADVTIEDIAHALSNQCRFTGHTREFYSVAEHAVLCAHYVASHDGTTQEIMEALMHDASEAYLADLARPVKHAPVLGDVYREAEGRLERAIGERFNLRWPMCDLVREADTALLGAEIHALMPEDFYRRWPAPTDDVPKPSCWAPKDARARFMKHYIALDALRTQELDDAIRESGWTL